MGHKTSKIDMSLQVQENLNWEKRVYARDPQTPLVTWNGCSYSFPINLSNISNHPLAGMTPLFKGECKNRDHLALLTIEPVSWSSLDSSRKQYIKPYWLHMPRSDLLTFGWMFKIWDYLPAAVQIQTGSLKLRDFTGLSKRWLQAYYPATSLTH